MVQLPHNDKTGSVILYIPEPGSACKTLDNISALTNGEASQVEVVSRPAIHNNKTENFHADVVVKTRVHAVMGHRASLVDRLRLRGNLNQRFLASVL
jgi:hypothetical protein